MINRDKVVFLFVLFILFLAIYFPPLKFLIISPEYLLVLLGLVWSLIHFKLFLSSFLKKSVFIYFIIQIIIVAYANYIDSVHIHASHMDLTSLYYFKQLRLLVNAIFICLVLATYLHYKKWSVNKLLKAFVIIGIIQGVISSLMLVVPAVKSLLLGIMNLTFLEESKEGIFMFRIFGLSSEYLFAFPIYQGFVLMIIFLQIVERKYKYVKYIPFILISIIFNARIGLFALPVVFLVYFFYLPSQRNSFKLVLKYFRILFFTGIFLFFCFLLTIQVIGYENFEYIFFRGVDSSGSEGHLYTLFDKMIFWPNTSIGFIFGEGRYLFGNEYDVKSDLGYINDLLFGGVVYIFTYFYNIKRILFQKMQNANLTYKTLITSCFIFILVCNFKGPILTNNGFIRALLIFVFLHILNGNQNKIIQIKN